MDADEARRLAEDSINAEQSDALKQVLSHIKTKAKAGFYSTVYNISENAGRVIYYVYNSLQQNGFQVEDSYVCDEEECSCYYCDYCEIDGECECQQAYIPEIYSGQESGCLTISWDSN